VRFIFGPPADAASGLLTLPWDLELQDWQDERLIEIRQRGISRHVVRFVADGGEFYALNSEELLRPDEQRYRIAERLRRLNELGFDADEVVLAATPEGTRMQVRTRVAESGHHSRQLFRETGIDADEQQARRLLNDIASFRGYLEQRRGRRVSPAVAAHRWLEEVYDPAVTAIPEGLRGKLPPPEIFHEILEHRWYLSEEAGRDVGTTAAAGSYFATVLPGVPQAVNLGPQSAAELALTALDDEPPGAAAEPADGPSPRRPARHAQG